eukprot:5988927-Ditylum_brightwellii.AAC.1
MANGKAPAISSIIYSMLMPVIWTKYETVNESNNNDATYYATGVHDILTYFGIIYWTLHPGNLEPLCLT